jgi:hypothetical protein
MQSPLCDVKLHMLQGMRREDQIHSAFHGKNVAVINVSLQNFRMFVILVNVGPAVQNHGATTEIQAKTTGICKGISLSHSQTLFVIMCWLIIFHIVFYDMQKWKQEVHSYLLRKWPRYRLNHVLLSVTYDDRPENKRVVDRAKKYMGVVHSEIMKGCGFFQSEKDINKTFDLVIKNLGREYRRIDGYSASSIRAIYIALKKMMLAKEKFNGDL